MFSKSLVFLALCSTAIFAANVCKNRDVITLPSNSSSFYWPATWNESLTTPELDVGQSCSWLVKVPQGYYAKLMMSGNGTDSRFQTIDAAGNLMQSTHEKMEPYYFPAHKFTITVANLNSTQFAFKIQWNRFPNAMKYNMTIEEKPHVENITQSVFQARFNCTKGISLLAFPANSTSHHTLRSTLVFEGENYNSSFVSNLESLYLSGQQWASSGNNVYVVNLESSGVVDRLLVQDGNSTMNIHNHIHMECQSNTTCTAKVNGEHHQRSSLISLGRSNHTLTNVQMDSNATMSVYYGAVNQKGLLLSLNGTNVNSVLPQMFNGSVVQYVISSGKAIFTFNA